MRRNWVGEVVLIIVLIVMIWAVHALVTSPIFN